MCANVGGMAEQSTTISAPALRTVEGPQAWSGPEMARRTDWIYTLQPAEVAEIEAALAQIKARGTEVAEIGADDFPLPRLGPVLDRLSGDVVDGRGFVLIRGLPVERWTIEEAAAAYWGLGLRFGTPVPQNAQGHLLGHVRDLDGDPANPMVRIYTTRARQEYHTDSCDIVALLCLKTAKSGGASALASSATIYNEMVRSRPDLAHALMQPIVVDRKEEVPAGKEPTYELAVFHDYAGHLTTIYARAFIEAAQTRPGTPRLTRVQIEAMDLLDSLAESDQIRLDMILEPGDIQVVHNHQILHSRTAYEDFDEPEKKRHLVRLWLAAHRGRPLPPGFAERYGPLDGGTPRGGIRVPGVTPHVSLTP